MYQSNCGLCTEDLKKTGEGKNNKKYDSTLPIKRKQRKMTYDHEKTQQDNGLKSKRRQTKCRRCNILTDGLL